MTKDSEDNVCKSHVFNQLYNKLSNQLYRYLVFKFGDEQTAEDVVQEAFVKLWQNCDKVTIGNAKAFLYTVARNRNLDILKTSKPVYSIETETHDPTDNQSADDDLIMKEYEQKLNQVFANMPEKLRVPFMLNRLENKTYNEIAEILNLSVKAIEKRMQKALVYLKENIDFAHKI